MHVTPTPTIPPQIIINRTDMDFKKQKAIYLQIADQLCERILANEWSADSRIPSVREVAVTLTVTPNTVMRTYEHLQSHGIIYTRRGLGYFVATDATELIKEMLQKEFVEEHWPDIVKRAQMLDIDLMELIKKGTK